MVWQSVSTGIKSWGSGVGVVVVVPQRFGVEADCEGTVNFFFYSINVCKAFINPLENAQYSQFAKPYCPNWTDQHIWLIMTKIRISCWIPTISPQLLLNEVKVAFRLSRIFAFNVFICWRYFAGGLSTSVDGFGEGESAHCSMCHGGTPFLPLNYYYNIMTVSDRAHRMSGTWIRNWFYQKILCFCCLNNPHRESILYI